MKLIQAIILVLAYGAVAYSSLSPPSLRPSVGFDSGNSDHLIAYLLLGILIAYVRVHGVQTRWLFLILPLYGTALELAQLIVPGRDASVENLLASIFGAWLGLTAGKVLRSLARQYLDV